MQCRQRAVDAGAQTERRGVLGRLLTLQRDLRRHHPLPLGDQRAPATRAVPVAAVPLVTLEPRHQSVVAAPGALGLPRTLLRRAREHRRAGAARRAERQRRRRLASPAVDSDDLPITLCHLLKSEHDIRHRNCNVQYACYLPTEGWPG